MRRAGNQSFQIMIHRPQPRQFVNEAAYRAALRRFEAQINLGTFMIVEDPVAYTPRKRSRLKTAWRRFRSHIMNRFCCTK